MVFLYVILGILALIALLLVSYFRVQLLYANETCILHICIGPIRYKVPMQKKVRYRKLAKKLRKKKLSSRAVSTAKKEPKKSQVLEELRGELPLPVFLKKLKDVLIDAAKQHAKKLHIQIDRLRITVGTGNPASTGISLYAKHSVPAGIFGFHCVAGAAWQGRRTNPCRLYRRLGCRHKRNDQNSCDSSAASASYSILFAKVQYKSGFWHAAAVR